MRLLLFGGTFDPPHTGHMQLLENAIRTARPDRVVVMPAGVPPHKQASATPARLRLAMCACFKTLFDPLDISDLEAHRQGKSYTLDTVRRLRGLYPGAEVLVSMGGDMLLSFRTWHRYEELLQEVELVVQSRHEAAGVLQKEAEILRSMGGRVLFTDGPALDISSTQIREGLAKGQDMRRFVPPPVAQLIKENHLYEEGVVPMTNEQASKMAKDALSAKRYHHVENVVALACELAYRFGADPGKAELAAWLHDVVKEKSRDELLQILRQDAIMAQSTLERPLPVWHGPCAVIVARGAGVEDPEILSAIECHTTGKVGMSKMDKILFLADASSAERSHPGVARVRALAQKDLNAAVIAVMEENIVYLTKKGKPLDTNTVQALEFMKQPAW